MRKLGFIIANDREEFLADYQETEELSSRSWSRIPDFSKVFRKRENAISVVKNLPDTYKYWVLNLYETESQFSVAYEGNDPPPWI